MSDEEKFEIPKEIELLAESIGFGPGYERTYKVFVVYVVRSDGSIYTSQPRMDRYFKSFRFAKEEADKINRSYQYRWDYGKNEMVRIENPAGFAFAKEIEVTERVL